MRWQPRNSERRWKGDSGRHRRPAGACTPAGLAMMSMMRKSRILVVDDEPGMIRAVERVRGGWRLKRLHRLLVTSAAYRQASTWTASAARIDAGNRLLWRYSPRRLEAEAVRDATLQVAGRLRL
ncbi:DUF1553 domain-containing protein, partial [Lacticaseibacillus rhamnosus]